MKKIGICLVIICVILLFLGILYLVFVEDYSFYRVREVSHARREIREYLNEKYNENFKNIEFVISYCLEQTSTGLFYSMPCTDSKIKNSIYQVHTDMGDFYVKEVSYGNQDYSLNDYDKSTQAEGFYDTYISMIVAEKLKDRLLDNYQNVSIDIQNIEIYEGLGIDSFNNTNLYQYLGNDFQHITNTDISISEFISYLPAESKNINVLLDVGDDITEDNFQEMVDVMRQLISSSNLYSSLSLQQMIIQFNNQNRYLEYSGGTIQLKAGRDVYDNSNPSIYSNRIVLGNTISTQGITYQDFMKLSSDKIIFSN